MNLKRFCYFVTVSYENFTTFNFNYVYIENFNHHFNFCVSKSFYYSTDDALLRKSFTDILNYDIHFTYILIHMANFLNEVVILHKFSEKAWFCLRIFVSQDLEDLYG